MTSSLQGFRLRFSIRSCNRENRAPFVMRTGQDVTDAGLERSETTVLLSSESTVLGRSESTVLGSSQSAVLGKSESIVLLSSENTVLQRTRLDTTCELV